MTNNKNLLAFVEEYKALCKADNVVWIDGSEEQLEALRAQAVANGDIVKLNEELLPGCYIARSNPNDVARVEGRTFICSKNKDDVTPINNWMETSEAYKLLNAIYDGCMKGRTMYVVPYSMGPVGSKFSKVGIELTDSIYVVLNMAIMTRVGKAVLDVLGEDGEFIKGIHSYAELDAEKRYIAHFPEDNVIMSINSNYGGNVLLGKKCFALRIASWLGKNEGWMAEHMLILGIEKPNGEINYVTGAFPSACGKTNLAMLIPPKQYLDKGYKTWCVGDDIAWIRVGEDGRLWAINPENGFFGVAPGTSMKSNPNALLSTKKNTIFTNVVHDLDTNTVWWEGMGTPAPKNAIDWKGNKWDESMVDADGKKIKGAHPNSRFTAPTANCPCLSSEFEAPNGVPLTAIIFGGRRAKTAPLVYQAKDWNNGVFVGSIMASETTAAAVGAVGVVRRDPMAMRPFIGYNCGDYFNHWLEMGKKIPNKPLIFNVNWFRTDDEGHFIWPGFGDNLRVLDWIISRCEGKVDARETAIGYVPYAEDINIDGLEDITVDTIEELLTVDKEMWLKEADGIEEFYKELGDRVPEELYNQLATLKANLNKQLINQGNP